MRHSFRAAALSAAVLTLCAAGGLAGPSFAAKADSTPVVSYAAHEGTSLSAETLGLNTVTDPAPAQPQSFDSQAAVVTHAIAPNVPQNPFDQADEPAAPEHEGRSLAALVSDHLSSETPDEETDCLARAVYWESKGEPLAGQLTVAEVIINRAHSGRFASTLCGVVRQRSQFSFVHGGFIPAAPQSSRDWRTAVAIARIATQNLADGGAPRALFFHARRVHPAWRLTQVAAIGNHVFYR